MPERCNANLFEALIGQVTQNIEINIILGKALSVLLETELFEPIRNLLHRRLYGFDAIRSGPACREVYQRSPISNSPGRRARHAESARLGIWFGSPLMSALGQSRHLAISNQCALYPRKRTSP